MSPITRTTEKTPVGWRLMLKTRISPEGCWLWTGYLDPGGYARVTIDDVRTVAHRVSWEYFVGPIPEGLTIDHRCRQRSCINPYHLEVVSLRDNILRGNATGAVNARKTQCSKGHPLSGPNLYTTPQGRRICRVCRRVNARRRMRAWRAKPKATP